MEMLALCALAPVEPGMNKADHLREILSSEQLSSDDSLCQHWRDRQWQIPDKDVKWLWKELEMEMSTSDNLGQGLQYKLASSAYCDTNFLFPKLVFRDQPVLAELCFELF